MQAPERAAIDPPEPEAIGPWNPESSPEERRAVIAQLIESKRFTAIITAIEANDQPIASAIFQTIVELGIQPPESLVEPIIAYLSEHAANADPMAVRSLAGVRTKAAITPVIALLQLESAGPRLTAEAMTTLREQTGREDLGLDPQAWSAWWEEARWLPPREWEAMLAVSHAERARRLQRESDQQVVRILDLHRKVYGLTPQDQRSALLVTMMSDVVPGVRALAFELAERALLNTQRLDDPVRIAAIEKLKDQSPSIRAAAASLLFRLGAGNEATEAIRRSIRREADPKAAAAMLEFLRRKPDETDLTICIEWLNDKEPASSAAARTLASAAVSGGLNRPHIRNQALATLRSLDTGTITPGKIELWGMLGESEDRVRIARMLDPAADPVTRRAAAAAIVRWTESVELLTLACRQDAMLFPMLADAVMLHRATPEGYRLVAEIAGVDAESRTQRLVRLRRGMPPIAILDSIQTGESLTAVIESVLFDPDQRDLLRRDPRLVLTQALVKARYDAGEDQAVVELVGQIDPGMVDRFSDDTRRHQCRALICIGRFNEADQAGADEADWQAAAQRSRFSGSGAATQIISEIDLRFPNEPAIKESTRERKPPSESEQAPDDRAPRPENHAGPGGMIQDTRPIEPDAPSRIVPERKNK
jgi:HEAT repeat protein